MYQKFIKRLIDIIFSSIALIILSPKILILWIWLTFANKGAGAGILFPHGNDITLANEIRKLCESPEEYIKVASSCQQRANNFDINFTAKKYLDLYTQLYV